MNLYTVMYKKKDTFPTLRIALPAKSAQLKGKCAVAFFLLSLNINQ